MKISRFFGVFDLLTIKLLFTFKFLGYNRHVFFLGDFIMEFQVADKRTLVFKDTGGKTVSVSDPVVLPLYSPSRFGISIDSRAGTEDDARYSYKVFDVSYEQYENVKDTSDRGEAVSLIEVQEQNQKHNFHKVMEVTPPWLRRDPWSKLEL